MTDPREKLSATQVRDASLADWRQILGRIKAQFRTADFATGLALVNKIGAAAEAANHHPDVQLTYSDVIVTLSSHDVSGITSRDLDLARQISSHAAELGIGSDASGLTQLELGLDTAHGPQLAPFYAALLGARWKTASRSTPVASCQRSGGRNRTVTKRGSSRTPTTTAPASAHPPARVRATIVGPNESSADRHERLTGQLTPH